MKKQYKIQGWIAVLLLVIGIGCLVIPSVNALVFDWVMTIVITAAALLMIHTARRKRSFVNIVIALAVSILAVVLWADNRPRSDLILSVFAIYFFLVFLFAFIQFLLDVKDRAKSTLATGMSCVLYLALAVSAWVFRNSDLKLVLAYFGIYLIILSLQTLVILHSFLHPSEKNAFHWTHWMALPVYFVSFLPGLYLRWMLKTKYRKDPLSWDQKKSDEPVNLRVWIHTGLSGEHLVGHMTFSYKGVMYSYGDYDRPAEKLFHTIGPGVLFTVPAEMYVNNCCIYESDTIFEYGCHLSDHQIALLEEQIEKLMKETYPWQCLLEKNGATEANFKKYEKYYADRLWYRTRCDFRMFYTGQWKTYWILDNNCSNFAQSVLSKIGCEIPSKTGIVSPGEYWEFFETLYEDPDSFVITRSWHDGTIPQTLFDVKQLY